MPIISIITPLHNKGPFIAQTITAVRAQSLKDWEMIVVENHSNDDGPSQVEAAAAIDSRIRLCRAPQSVRGPGAARNFGLGIAQGEWVLFLDADDLLDATYLYNLLSRHKADPEANVIAAPWTEFTDGDEPSNGAIKQPAAYSSFGEGIEDAAIAITCWAVHAAIVRRSWLSKRHWPEELDGYLAEDTAFWFRVICGAKIAYSDLPGAFYRTQTENCRTNYSARIWYEGNHRAVLVNLDYLNKQGKKPSKAQMEMLVRLYETLYDKAIREGEREVARSALIFAESWLNKSASLSELQSIAMILRKLLGIRLFRFVKNLTLSIPSKYSA